MRIKLIESPRNSFKEHRLIFDTAGQNWVGLPVTVWSGPPSIRSKIYLKPIYPSLHRLFVSHLKIADPPWHTLLVAELRSLTKLWKGKRISDTIHNQTVQMLRDVAVILEQDPTPPTWLEGLRTEAIFPTYISDSQGTFLRPAGARFFIPNNFQYKEICEGHIPLLSLLNIPISKIQPLLDSVVFKAQMRYLGAEMRAISACIGPRIAEVRLANDYTDKLAYIERCALLTYFLEVFAE